MHAHFLSGPDFPVLKNPGVESVQLVCAETCPGSPFSVTRVTVQPGGVQARHTHEGSEQVWMALEGAGHLLLEGDERRPFMAGEVARFPAGSVHGFENSTTEAFVYLTVTSPPLDFTDAYAEKNIRIARATKSN